MGKFWKAMCIWKRRKNSKYDFEYDQRMEKHRPVSTSNLNRKSEDGNIMRYNSLPCIPWLGQDERRLSSIIITSASYYKEAEHWKKEQVLGCGQYGTCYQCLDVLSGQLMAVKQVPFMGPGMDKNMLQDEIMLLGRVKHPNVIRIMGATQDNAHFNIFMEWMPGGSVSSLLEKFGSFHENVIISYTRQVLTGLAYLHDNKILHRDLKGSNLLVDGTGRQLRISDFGAAGCLHSQATAEGEFEGQVTGTIPFMAPEVIRGENYGRSSDIWSVGCVVIEMVTACLPWTSPETAGLNHYQLMYKIARTAEPPPFPTNRVSNSTRNMAMRCLKIDPNQRPSANLLLTHTVFNCCNSSYEEDEDGPTLLSSAPSTPSIISRPVLINRVSLSALSYDDATWRSDFDLIGESADI